MLLVCSKSLFHRTIVKFVENIFSKVGQRRSHGAKRGSVARVWGSAVRICLVEDTRGPTSENNCCAWESSLAVRHEMLWRDTRARLTHKSHNGRRTSAGSRTVSRFGSNVPTRANATSICLPCRPMLGARVAKQVCVHGRSMNNIQYD